MQSRCFEVRLSTKHVAYFKKMVTRQNRLCSEVTMSFHQNGLTMHGTSATDNIVLTLFLDKIFFHTYICAHSRVVRINIYHLHKIIKRVTSFMYHTVHLQIFKEDNADYNWMHLMFETENRTDRFHTRVFAVKDAKPTLSRESLMQLSPSHTVQMKMSGVVLLEALNKFDTDMFQTVTFKVRAKYKQSNAKNDTTRAFKIGVEAENDVLVVRGRTDNISGKVNVRATTGGPAATKHLGISKHRYSLELLCKSMAFFQLSEKPHCSVQFFPHFKLMCLSFELSYGIYAEIILPHMPLSAWEECIYSSASDTDDT